ncbi:hypothetical protein A3I18_00310 [Candidatus Campbellbacteria bacterium RIFCSPLOWO2_02_FULL_35_11]|uniref:Glycerate kinase n=1 Tax=Candidatus Campbellbacteria bacterium RIFCSPLOWO2_02_FULL_35_11 TaxID=1797581 RepID=A0A1F5ETI1_9BACT|nr:MAG: hypothetical protein A3I18_00310 [Candidatus Campbellbacteria bacterium RIFCSPLOWO2_02_FULL_35_11]
MDTKFPIIKNIDELGDSQLKEDALEILEEGYESIMVERLIKSKVELKDGHICFADKKICLDDYEKIYLIAFGKCAVSSATAFEEILGSKISGGIVLDVKKEDFKHLVSEEGTHPLSSPKNVFVTKNIVEILKEADKRDLILLVISGGGSSLLCLPYISEIENQKMFIDELMKKGATIKELNTVRKHISLIKGGQLAEMAYPAKLVSFILSDVPGDDLSVIASGPTVMDKTTIDDAQKIIDKYKMDVSMRKLNIFLKETPKKEKFFENSVNILLGSNMIALEAMKKKAECLGYNAYIENSKLEGEAKVVSPEIVSRDYRAMSCHLWGGETTVKVTGGGVGGRNQEFVLSALPFIVPNMVVVAAASDGWDNSDVAGAIGDIDLYNKALDLDLDADDFLKKNNSYDFFKQAGGHIKTGRTGENVADFYMILKGSDGED